MNTSILFLTVCIGYLISCVTAQRTYYDSGFPPAPARWNAFVNGMNNRRRNSAVRNALNGVTRGRLQQAQEPDSPEQGVDQEPDQTPDGPVPGGPDGPGAPDTEGPGVTTPGGTKSGNGGGPPRNGGTKNGKGMNGGGNGHGKKNGGMNGYGNGGKKNGNAGGRKNGNGGGMGNGYGNGKRNGGMNGYGNGGGKKNGNGGGGMNGYGNGKGTNGAGAGGFSKVNGKGGTKNGQEPMGPDSPQEQDTPAPDEDEGTAMPDLPTPEDVPGDEEQVMQNMYDGKPKNGRPTNGIRPLRPPTKGDDHIDDMQQMMNGIGRKNGNGQRPTNGYKPRNGGGRNGYNGGGDHGGDDHGGGHDGHDGGDHDGHHGGDPIQWLRDAIRGEPGQDYPIFAEVPETAFKCSDHEWPGYYADVEARCQVFHICQMDGRSDAFLCPNGTIFSQQHFVCVWWHDFDCSTAESLYQLNSNLFQIVSNGQQSQDVDGDDDKTGQLETFK